MKNAIPALIIMMSFICCNVQPKSDNLSGDKTFSLKLKPAAGSKFKYDVSNESKTKIEVNDKTVINITKSDVTVRYAIDRDSSGNYVVGIKYDKIHIYTKTGDSETDVDTDNPVSSSDPVEQMLGALKAATISAIINPAGQVVKVNGYQQVLDRISGGMDNEDPGTKAIIQKRWQQMVEQNLVKKNMNQFFDLFPDSAVHVGDNWKFLTREKDDIAFMVNNSFTLKSINDGIAVLASRGQITSDSTATHFMGYDVTSTLNGEQRGEYEVDIKAGMPNYIKVTIDIDGLIQVNGRDIPFSLKSSVKMNGHQEN